MITKATQIITQHLQPTEVLIWAGQPKKGIVFEVADIFKTLFMAVFLAFTWFAVKSLSQVSLLLSVPVGIFFFSIGFLLTIARFFIDAELRKNTFYGLTGERIIIVSAMFPKKIQSVYLHSDLKIDFLPNLNDTSTIDIGLKEPTARSGGISWSPNAKGYSYLYRLTDADFVHRTIREMIKSKKETNSSI